MALVASAFITSAGVISTSAGPFSTASKTWVSGDWYVLWINNRVSSGTPNTPTVTINGTSLTQIRSDIEGSGLVRITALCFLGDGSTGVATISVAAQTQASIQWSCDQWTGGLNTGTNGINNVVATNTNFSTGTGSTISTTLSAFADATNNAAYIHAYNQGGNTMTPKAGYTGLSVMSGLFADKNAYIVGQDTAPNETQGANTDAWSATAMEIAAAGGGGGTFGRLVGGTLCGGMLVGGLLVGN